MYIVFVHCEIEHLGKPHHATYYHFNCLHDIDKKIELIICGLSITYFSQSLQSEPHRISCKKLYLKQERELIEPGLIEEYKVN